jgi:hypothetical protein
MHSTHPTTAILRASLVAAASAASAILTLAAVAPGCGSSSGSPAAPDAGSDTTTTVDSSMAADVADASVGYPAPFPATPTVLNDGGPVMKAPKIVAITFPDDTLAPNLDDFVAKFTAASAYWAGATAEYGVGPMAKAIDVLDSEVFPANTTLADTDIQAFLQARILGKPLPGADAGAEAGAADAGTPYPAADANTIYTFFFPTQVTVSLQGSLSCQGFDGYHGDFALPDGTFVTYAVVTRCPPQAPGLSEIDSVAATTSHEFIEAATDPLAIDKPAWSTVDPDHMAWEYVGGGGEIGDMCAAYPDAFYKPAGLPYLVQRVWSNKQAALGHDPCQPGGASPYFATAPVLNDTLMVNDPMAGMFTTKGVKIPVGKSVTIDLDLFSDAPTSGPWTVEPIDVFNMFYGTAPLLSFKFAGGVSKGQNGDKLQLTITVLPAAKTAGIGGVEAFAIQSTLGNVHAEWYGLIGN